VKIAITGATGFVGKNLLKVLEPRPEYRIVALTRRLEKEMDGVEKGHVTWRKCNGFSLLEVEDVLKDVDVLFYLIHSMAPSAGLKQGEFDDFDIVVADNFARAAQKNKIKQIIYLGGILPSDQLSLSSHLRSRLEVEKVLGNYGNHVTILRAGLVLGRDGSSFRILERLIKRLPILICPAWTKNEMQPIDLDDLMTILVYCIDQPKVFNQYFNIGAKNKVTYQQLLELTAKALGLKRIFISVPLFSPSFSKLWVSKVTAVSSELVYPLIDSLLYNMVIKDHPLIVPAQKLKTVEESLDGIFISQKFSKKSAKAPAFLTVIKSPKTVTSVQRLKPPKGMNAAAVAKEYFDWLPTIFRFLLTVKINNNSCQFRLLKKIVLLELNLSLERSGPDRQVYYINGGILWRPTKFHSRLEFRQFSDLDCCLVGIYDYRPALPWFIYKWTQALVHSIVMRCFGSYLKQLSR
jgi:uncharacterized protein YbjT (DUF2867 family)